MFHSRMSPSFKPRFLGTRHLVYCSKPNRPQKAIADMTIVDGCPPKLASRGASKIL